MNTKRIFALLLCLVMVFSCLPMSAFAAGDQPNITYSVNATEVNVGDTVTVKIGIKEMNVSSFAFGFDFSKELLTATSIPPAALVSVGYALEYEGEIYPGTMYPSTVSKTTEANNSGHVGVTFVSTEEYLFSEKAAVVTVKFTATAAGIANFTFFEDSAGTDGYKSENAGSLTVTINAPAAHECADDNKDHKCDNGCDVPQGTHADSATDNDHVCDYCGKAVEPVEPCSDKDADGDHSCDVCGKENVTGHTGGTATCKDKAVCSECGQSYGDLAGHTYGDLIEAKEAVHTADELAAGVAAHYHCSVCGKYFTEGKTETTLAALTGETPAHTYNTFRKGDKLSDATCTAGSTYELLCDTCDHVHETEKVTDTDKLSHEDTDNDHICNNGCNAKLSDCADNNNDHLCDVCKDKLTDCSDKDGDGDHECDTCGKENVTDHVPGAAATCTTAQTCTECGFELAPMLGHKDENKDHVCDNGCGIPQGTHADAADDKDHVCDYCGKAVENGETCADVTTDKDHLCDICGEPVGGHNYNAVVTPPTCEDKGYTTYTCDCGDVYTADEVPALNHAWGKPSYKDNGDGTHTASYVCANDEKHTKSDEPAEHTYTDGKCVCGADAPVAKLGWTEEEDGWYYYYEDETFATGVSRVPYPSTAINGVTYAPADEIAQAPCTGFDLDKTTGLFLFGEDGKFQSETTGKGTWLDATRYAKNGHIAWHPGLVLEDGNYYYFLGDETLGGNILATGDVYMARNNTERDVVIGGIYTFSEEDGKLCEYDGITDVKGILRYYEDARLMIGNGLTEVGDEFIYVRYDGSLVVSTQFWVGTNELGVVEGVYDFDANGFLQNAKPTEKNGVYFEDGAWYYYENGVRAANKGLIEVTDVAWHEDNSATNASGTIYVKYNGQLATGNYFITNVSNYPDSDAFAYGDYLTFNDMGLMEGIKNGIVNENGTLYYYKKNVKQYGAGVIQLDGNYYYVRSNGVVVSNGSYWITNVGDSGIAARCYTFDANGVMQNPVLVEFAGVIGGYYYENGAIAYGKGLVKITDETGTYYIYVKSNGTLATGKYWPTTTNGYDVSGMLDFGAEGKYYI